jgi:hypothetical protein
MTLDFWLGVAVGFGVAMVIVLFISKSLTDRFRNW